MHFIFSKRGFATLLLVTMLIQYIPGEGLAISFFKVCVMGLCPFVWFFDGLRLNKAFFWGAAYMLIVFFFADMHPETFRASTIIYKGLFFFAFFTFYTLLYQNVFPIDYFIGFLKVFLYANAAVILIQNLFLAVGIHDFAPINLFMSESTLFRTNGLNIEPSHAGRVLVVAFYALLKCSEYVYGKLPFGKLYKTHKLAIWCGLFSIFGIGSGTAMIGFAVVCLYFLQRRYVIYFAAGLAIVFYALPLLENEAINRAIDTAAATITGDSEMVLETDGSAAVRILPLFNTLQNLDLTDYQDWIGHGINADMSDDTPWLNENNMIGGIREFGLLSYLVLLLFIYSCCINRILSIETLLFVFVLLGSLGNVAYGWGIMMIFAVIKYFDARPVPVQFPTVPLKSVK